MTSMRNIEVNGRTVKTNYEPNGYYPMHSGNPGKTQRLVIKVNNRETDDELFERCARMGFKSIRLVRTSTAIRGWHETVALCRR